ncbi:VanZ family protein [Bacillus sp. 37MA]|uniref:VanZ family protein n=1 Tax=Bacillus sp. 37MA TaxID=1132442 RepID=UPI00036D1475|nr:VanZ family protein [Bacillus sp. 37MA]
MYKTLSCTAVIFLMALIFYLSYQSATTSNELSKGITEIIVEKVEKIDPNTTEFDIRSLNHIIIKNILFLVYLVLGVKVLNDLRRSGIYGYRRMGMALLMCLLYEISGEVHQLFVPGRGPGVKDVFIDSTGAIGVGIVSWTLFS